MAPVMEKISSRDYRTDEAFLGITAVIVDDGNSRCGTQRNCRTGIAKAERVDFVRLIGDKVVQ